jgi:hypothetical protein
MVHGSIQPLNLALSNVTSYGLDYLGSIHIRPDFSLFHHIHTSSGAHPTFYPMRIRCCFPASKAVGGSCGSSISMVSGYMDWMTRAPQQGQNVLLLVSVFRPALGPTQPPIQWVLGFFHFQSVKHGWGVMLTTHPHIVLRLRTSISYAISPLKHLHSV